MKKDLKVLINENKRHFAFWIVQGVINRKIGKYFRTISLEELISITEPELLLIFNRAIRELGYVVHQNQIQLLFEKTKIYHCRKINEERDDVIALYVPVKNRKKINPIRYNLSLFRINRSGTTKRPVQLQV